LLAAMRQAAANRFDAHTWQLAWALVHVLEAQGHPNQRAAFQEAGLAAVRRLAEQPAQADTHSYLGRTNPGPGRHDAHVDLPPTPTVGEPSPCTRRFPDGFVHAWGL